MTKKNPSARPTAEAAEKMFHEIVSQKSKVLLRRRLTPVEPTWIGNAYRAMASIADEIAFQTNYIFRMSIACSKRLHTDVRSGPP